MKIIGYALSSVSSVSIFVLLSLGGYEKPYAVMIGAFLAAIAFSGGMLVRDGQISEQWPNGN